MSEGRDGDLIGTEEPYMSESGGGVEAVTRASREAAGFRESAHSDNRGSPTVPGPPLSLAKIERDLTLLDEARRTGALGWAASVRKDVERAWAGGTDSTMTFYRPDTVPPYNYVTILRRLAAPPQDRGEGAT